MSSQQPSAVDLLVSSEVSRVPVVMSAALLRKQ